MNQSNSPGLRDWLILVGLSLVWGTSYILIKWGLEVFEAQQIGQLRLGISAVFVAPFALRYMFKLKRKTLFTLLAVGLTGTALPSFLFPAAQRHLSSSVAGIFSSLTPLVTFLMAWLIFRSGASKKQGIGIAIGLAGAIILATAGGGDSAGQNAPLQLTYVLLILLACTCYATSSNLVANYLKDMPSLRITAISFFMVGFPALVYSLTAGGVLQTMQDHPRAWEGLSYVAFLAIFGTVLASLLFFWLVQRTGSVFASTVSYLVPAVALGWGFFDGEFIGLPQVAAFLLILCGVFLTKRN
ncbi:MAG: EamA family transporter [Bacteroidota bacterium]